MDSYFKRRKQFRQLGFVQVIVDELGKHAGGCGGFSGVFDVARKNARDSRVGEVLSGELCSRERYRPLKTDMPEAEVYRLGFCRFIRPVLQSLRSWRLSESALTFQSEQKCAIRFVPLRP